MNPLPRFMKRLSILLGRRRFRSELEEEMAFHRAQAEKEFAAAGMTPEAARHAAARQFGNATRLKEQSHEVVGFRVETVMQDAAICAAAVAKESGVCGDGDSDSGAGHGRERGDVRLCGCGAAAAAAVSRIPTGWWRGREQRGVSAFESVATTTIRTGSG